MTKPLIIGLTGGIASGKSSVSRMLMAAGVPLCDTDQLAHDVVASGSKGLALIRQSFGEDMIDPLGNLDRAKLGALVFSNAEARQTLNKIIHPLVFEGVSQWKARQIETGAKLLVIDMPLLFETGYDQQVDASLVVCVSPDQQVQRLMARNGFSLEEAQARIAAQMPQAEKIARADYLIDNSGSLEETQAQVDDLLKKLDFPKSASSKGQ